MNYTLHQLQVFLKVTQTESITRAAEELYLTQPAVSIQMKNFQDQFDIPLTEVVSRKLYITDFGREIAAAAENILNEVNNINYKTTAYKGQLGGRLRISVVSTGKYVIPYFLSDFLRENEHVELVLDVTNKQKVVNALEENEVDFALVSVLPAHLSIYNMELMENKLFLVGGTDSRDSGEIHSRKMLEKLPLLYREAGSGTRSIMERFLESNRLKTQKKLELTSNEAVKQAVVAGLGYSIMPLIGIKHELLSGDIKIMNIKGLPLRSQWNLVWMKSKKLSPAANAFLDHLGTHKERIISEKFNWTANY